MSVLLSLLVACSDVSNPDEENAQEVITTVSLTFTDGGGTETTFAWSDPENDGSPVIDPIVLSDASDYTLAVSFLNELAKPTEDITEEVDAESDQHQVFFTGTAVSGPSTGDNAAAVISQAYDDTDVNGFPVGLRNDIGTLQAGTGGLTVTLRHMPPENDVAVKTGTLTDTVASGGIDALPGETDATVDFDVTVE